MNTYKVKAINTQGETYETTVEAADKFGVYEKIRQDKATVVQVTEEKKHTALSINMSLFGRIGTHQKILIAKNLSAMLEAGLSISRALTVLERQTKQKALKDVLISLNTHISGGKTLHEALAQHPKVFSPLFISMTKAGEESGSLVQSLKTVALQMERSYELTRKIRGAMMYPGVILLAMGGIAFFMLTYVVPQITATFKELNVPLPFTTRLVIGVSDFVSNHSIIALLMCAAIGIGFYGLLKQPRARRYIDFLVLHIPIVGTLVKHTNAARTTRTLASLLVAGVDVLVATQITSEVLQNSYYKDVLIEVKRVVEKGDPMADVFNRNEWLYPPFVGEMVAVGEETGQLSSMLQNVAVFYEAEVEQKTKDMSTIIEPFLMIVIGTAVGFFAVSMMGPIYSIGNAIN